ncbi:MAG: hypothetical protein HUJ51_00480, partial [Eggerthellaceae bacterium]|nr:hypothetical protein [Eggerthellaceae bacterium]
MTLAISTGKEMLAIESISRVSRPCVLLCTKRQNALINFYQQLADFTGIVVPVLQGLAGVFEVVDLRDHFVGWEFVVAQQPD